MVTALAKRFPAGCGCQGCLDQSDQSSQVTPHPPLGGLYGYQPTSSRLQQVSLGLQVELGGLGFFLHGLQTSLYFGSQIVHVLFFEDWEFLPFEDWESLSFED